MWPTCTDRRLQRRMPLLAICPVGDYIGVSEHLTGREFLLSMAMIQNQHKSRYWQGKAYLLGYRHTSRKAVPRFHSNLADSIIASTLLMNLRRSQDMDTCTCVYVYFDLNQSAKSLNKCDSRQDSKFVEAVNDWRFDLRGAARTQPQVESLVANVFRDRLGRVVTAYIPQHTD